MSVRRLRLILMPSRSGYHIFAAAVGICGFGTALQDEFPGTTILVTHDPVGAAVLADELLILQAGLSFLGEVDLTLAFDQSR
jgi:hypothetical protein